MAALEGCNASPESLARPHRAAASDAVVRIAQGFELEAARDPPDNPNSGTLPVNLNHYDEHGQQHATQRVRKRKASKVKLLLPHQLAAQRTADFDLDILRKRALLGLQVQAGLDACPADKGVYETDKWDPCKPFVADKMLSLPCMLGRPVVYSSSTLVNIRHKGTACAEGHVADKLTIQCHGCNFKGSRTRYEQHLGSNAKKSSQHIWLREEQISIKELAVLCSAVDLSLTHCIYCKQDQCSDVQAVGKQSSTHSTPAGEAAAMPARPATAEFPPALADADRGVSEAAGTSSAAAAAAAATDCGADSKGLGAAECQLRPRNTLAACSTCPAVFHTNCYHSNTGEEVGEGDDWQCVSCRQGAECASSGCNWCSQHAPHERTFTMTGLLDELKHELEPQQAEGQIRRASGRAKKPPQPPPPAAAAAGQPKPQRLAAAGCRTALDEGLAATGAGPTSPATPAAAAAALAAAGYAVAPAVAEKHQCLDEPAAPAQAPGSKPAEPQQVLQSPHGTNPAVDIAPQAAFGTVAGGAPAAPAPAPARRSKGRASAAAPAAAAVGAAAGGCGDSPSNKAQQLKTPARKKARIANPLSTPPAATPEVTTAGTTAGNQSGQQVAAQLQSREEHAAAAAATAAAAGDGGRRRRRRQQQGQQHKGALANNVQQQDHPPATLGTPDAPAQQQQHPGTVTQQQQGPGASQLDLGLLGVAEWLPAWSNQYQAEADLYSLCMAAEAPDSLVQQLQAVMDRLQGLQAADLAVCQFKAHYTRLQLWGKRRNAAEFEAALLRLASMG